MWIAGPMSIDDLSQIENHVTPNGCHFAFTHFERNMLITKERDNSTKFGMHTHLNEGYIYQK